jgi:ribosomal protein S27AE
VVIGQSWFDKGVDVYICGNQECPKCGDRNQPEGRKVSDLEKAAARQSTPVCPHCGWTMVESPK